MKIVVLGAGALGTIFAAHLLRDGHDVSIAARGRRAAQVEGDGLRVSGLDDIRVACPVITDPAAISSADLLIVTVKTYDNAPALVPLATDNFASVFSVANGVLKNSELLAHFDSAAPLGCMANTSGELLDDGEVRFTRNVCLHIGELDGELSKRVRRIADVINRCGIRAQAEENISAVEWSKFVGWTAFLSLAVATRLPTGRFLADPDCALLMSTMIHEMASLARARKIVIFDQSPMPVASISAGSIDAGKDIILELGRDWLESAPNHRLSGLQDLERGKRLEVEETLGYAVGEATRLGVNTPTLQTFYKLLSGINRTMQRA